MRSVLKFLIRMASSEVSIKGRGESLCSSYRDHNNGGGASKNALEPPKNGSVTAEGTYARNSTASDVQIQTDLWFGFTDAALSCRFRSSALHRALARLCWSACHCAP